MVVRVVTKSGSCYVFKQFGRETMVIRNYVQEARLKKPVEIELDKPLAMEIYSEDSFCQKSGDTDVWASSVVKSITIE